MMEKYGWDRHTYETIDWESFGNFMKMMPGTKLANIVKYQYDWQYTRKWEDRITKSGKKY